MQRANFRFSGSSALDIPRGAGVTTDESGPSATVKAEGDIVDPVLSFALARPCDGRAMAINEALSPLPFTMVQSLISVGDSQDCARLVRTIIWMHGGPGSKTGAQEREDYRTPFTVPACSSKARLDSSPSSSARRDDAGGCGRITKESTTSESYNRLSDQCSGARPVDPDCATKRIALRQLLWSYEGVRLCLSGSQDWESIELAYREDQTRHRDGPDAIEPVDILLHPLQEVFLPEGQQSLQNIHLANASCKSRVVHSVGRKTGSCGSGRHGVVPRRLQVTLGDNFHADTSPTPVVGVATPGSLCFLYVAALLGMQHAFCKELLLLDSGLAREELQEILHSSGIMHEKDSQASAATEAENLNAIDTAGPSIAEKDAGSRDDEITLGESRTAEKDAGSGDGGIVEALHKVIVDRKLRARDDLARLVAADQIDMQISGGVPLSRQSFLADGNHTSTSDDAPSGHILDLTFNERLQHIMLPDWASSPQLDRLCLNSLRLSLEDVSVLRGTGAIARLYRHVVDAVLRDPVTKQFHEAMLANYSKSSGGDCGKNVQEPRIQMRQEILESDNHCSLENTAQGIVYKTSAKRPRPEEENFGESVPFEAASSAKRPRPAEDNFGPDRAAFEPASPADIIANFSEQSRDELPLHDLPEYSSSDGPPAEERDHESVIHLAVPPVSNSCPLSFLSVYRKAHTKFLIQKNACVRVQLFLCKKNTLESPLRSGMATAIWNADIVWFRAILESIRAENDLTEALQKTYPEDVESTTCYNLIFLFAFSLGKLHRVALLSSKIQDNLVGGIDTN